MRADGVGGQRRGRSAPSSAAALEPLKPDLLGVSSRCPRRRQSGCPPYRRCGRPIRSICAPMSSATWRRSASRTSSPPRAWKRPCATRSWPAGSGSARVLSLATAEALGRPRDAVLPSGGRDRAHPHVFAHPRRPPGHGRRRPAARAADLSQGLWRGRGDPGRRRSLRKPRPSGCCSPSSAPSRRDTCWPRRARAGLCHRSGWDGRRGQYIDVAETAPEGPAESAAAARAFKTGRWLIGASIRCVLILVGDHKPDTIDSFHAYASELGVLFSRSSTTSST